MSEPVSLLPPNRTALESALEQAVRTVKPDLTPVRRLMSPQFCPPELLLWLAWAFSVDVWDEGWSEENKRQVLAASLSVHRRKGTLGAVKAALQAAGYGDAEVIERFGWERHDGTYLHDGSIAHTAPDHWAEYRIRLARPITLDQAAQVRAILDTVAPARCHLKALDFTQALNLYNGAIAHDGAFSHGVA